MTGAAHAVTTPPQAQSVGYTNNTFSSVFTIGTVDLANTDRQGFQWYPWNYFGSKTQLNKLIVNKDNSVTLYGDVTGPNGELVTAAATKNAPNFVGTAFGGGLYVEAKLKFDPKTVNTANGWPAFWSMAWEHLLGSGPQWLGMPSGYLHFAEADFFEYDLPVATLGQNYFGGNMHDWNGIYKVSCPGYSFCDTALAYSDVKKQVPAATDFTKYHTYGYLWVPATQTANGYARTYFDGVQIGNDVTWKLFGNQQGSPANQPWKFGIIDAQHLILILGTGPNEPMTVASVNVWQKDATQNLHY